MDKKYFVIHLHPSRSDFSTTMTNEERSVMQSHIAYWTNYMNQGVMLVFGPVLDPKGTYGLGIVATDSEASLQSLLKADPASAIAEYDYYPMMAVVPQKHPASVGITT